MEEVPNAREVDGFPCPHTLNGISHINPIDMPKNNFLFILFDPSSSKFFILIS
jgi:hypothetical protein